MSLLVVGLSHRSTPVALLERVALDSDALRATLRALVGGEHVAEALVLSTCNRVELYADVDKFHGGVQQVSEVLSAVTGVPFEELSSHLYVHYEDRAVQHLFTVACGLDSMVIGEAQIIGQLRLAVRVAQAERALGRVLGELTRAALRVGKRAHSETGIDRAGASLVGVGLDLAADTLGGIAGRSALVVGAGSMGALAAATLQRREVGAITIVNRTPATAERLAATYGGRGAGLDDLAGALAEADVVIASTGAIGTVVPYGVVAAAAAERGGRPLFVLDLALPRDVDPAIRELVGVTLADLETLRGVLQTAQVAADVDAARRLVTDEVAGFLAWQRSARVAPTVVALRTKAADVVDAELARLLGRLPDLGERERAEVESTLRRVVDKLLHTPTVRVKELAEGPDGGQYAEALRELFELDPAAPDVVARADVTVEASVEDAVPLARVEAS